MNRNFLIVALLYRIKKFRFQFIPNWVMTWTLLLLLLTFSLNLTFSYNGKNNLKKNLQITKSNYNFSAFFEIDHRIKKTNINFNS